MRTLFEGELFADYFQLVVEDVAAERQSEEDYGEAAMQRRVTTSAQTLIIFTARNMAVPLKVSWRDARPEVELAGFDHAVEASFSAPSGRVRIMGLTDATGDAACADVPAGPVRALALSAGLGTLSEDELDGDDRYELHLWSEPLADPLVLKQWAG